MIEEINLIYTIEIDTNKFLNNLIKKYKIELENFEYATEINEIIQLKNIYIRYISIKGKLNYGGFYYKVIKKNKKFYILLINKYKKIWEVSFDDNFIFYLKILNTNETKRDMFTNFIKKYSN
jgi:hypothetical protein